MKRHDWTALAVIGLSALSGMGLRSVLLQRAGDAGCCRPEIFVAVPEPPTFQPPTVAEDYYTYTVTLVPPPETPPTPGLAPADIEAAPTFTPFTVRPELTNSRAVGDAMEEAYPPLLRDAGIGGTVDVWFLIDEEGHVVRTQVDKSSGHKALDDAALTVANMIEFGPAFNRDKPVPVWISLPITFSGR